MERIKQILKENYKFLIVMVVLALVFFLPLPYYIEAPGGITSLNNRINIDNKSIDGSYNLTYVAEYKGSIPMLIYAFFNKDFDIYKKEDILLEQETDEEYNRRDKLYLEESLSNAIIASYNMAGMTVNIKNQYLYVGYKLEDSNTTLQIGDAIINIDGIEVTTKEEVSNILNTKNIGDQITIEVINNGKKYTRVATVINESGQKIIGIIPIEVIDYDTSPEISITMDSNESGSSGGLMLSLAIYDLLTDDNLARGRKIAGTGTIDSNGNVGIIGGIEYKIKGAIKDQADIFFVPVDNYQEAKQVITDNNYKLNLVKVSTLSEAVEYLKNN